MKMAAYIIISLACLYFCFLAAVYFFANSLMFHPPAQTYAMTFEHLKIAVKGGEISAVCLKAEKPKGFIFYSHGNGEDLGIVYPLLDAFRKLGYTVFSYDYPGYGISNKRVKPTEAGMYESALAAWEYARKNLGFEPKNTFLFGFSLGSAPTCLIASRETDIRGVILAGGIANGAKTFLPVNIVPWKILDNSSKVANFKRPLLIVHGSNDNIVSPHNARENFEAAKCPKKLVVIDGFGHNDLSAAPLYKSEIEEFLKNTK